MRSNPATGGFRVRHLRVRADEQAQRMYTILITHCLPTPTIISYLLKNRFALAAVPMFARVYRISTVFNNKKLRTIAVRENDVMRLCAPFWILWLVNHVLWMVSKTPPKLAHVHHIEISVPTCNKLNEDG